MPRLPEVGGDQGNWGEILNEFLSQSLNENGDFKAGVVGSAQLSNGAVTTSKLATGAVTETELSEAVQTKLNSPSPTKESLGLSEVENTSDANKPISTATQTALNNKADTTMLTSKMNIPTYVATSDVTGTLSLAPFTNSSVIQLRLIGNLTITALPPTPFVGQTLTLVLTQDTAGSRTLTLPVSIKKTYGLAPVLSTAAGSQDVLHLFYDGVNWHIFVAGLGMA